MSMFAFIQGVHMCAGVQRRVSARTRIVLGYARACMTHLRPQTTCGARV